jgi:hypothetical protein
MTTMTSVDAVSASMSNTAVQSEYVIPPPPWRRYSTGQRASGCRSKEAGSSSRTFTTPTAGESMVRSLARLSGSKTGSEQPLGSQWTTGGFVSTAMRRAPSSAGSPMVAAWLGGAEKGVAVTVGAEVAVGIGVRRAPSEQPAARASVVRAASSGRPAGPTAPMPRLPMGRGEVYARQVVPGRSRSVRPGPPA